MFAHEAFDRRAGLGPTQGNKNGPRTVTSSSLSAMLSSVVVNGLIFFILIIVFLLLRKLFKRVYTPRSFVGSVPAQKRVQEAPTGFFAIFKTLLSKQ